MRISDWSSDVCSSDLNSDFAEIGSLAVSAAPVESSEGLRLPKTPEPLDEVDLECDAVPAPLQASADVRENIPAASSPVEDPAGIITSGRSEENTSELQSLMRISYTDF